jgi:hypothetical protein
MLRHLDSQIESDLREKMVFLGGPRHFVFDSEGRELDLRYSRDVDGRELDFVVLERKRPIMLVEAKLTGEAATPASPSTLPQST